jgi:polar amino acid transport system ATP-binding protein
VEKRYGDLVVLDGLDLDVARGEKLAIIGGSGSGKSTILRILMTLEGIDAGRVEIAGEPVFTEERSGREVPASEAHLRRIRRRVGMVFQHFNLFPHMSALGNVIEAPRRVLGLSKDEAGERARKLLARVGLAEKEDAYPSQLSGGQQQRVAIARALAMDPRLLLLDEVTSALDPELVQEVLLTIRRLAEAGTTMLIVTHEMRFARDVSDRVVFMDAGRIAEQGSPQLLFGRPDTPRLKEFLGKVAL